MHVPSLLATVLLDPPTALLFGAAISLLSARLIAKDPDAETRRTVMLGAGWGLFYALCVSWFFFKEPDWMFAYLRDGREVSLVPAFIVFALVTSAFGAIGALANSALLRRGRRGAAWGVTIAAIVTLGSIFWLQWDQYFLLGSTEEFWTGRARPLQEDATMQLAMNVSGAASSVGAIALFVMRHLQARRALAEAGSGSTQSGPAA